MISVWCTDRHAGNLGDRVGDDPARVAGNRQALATALDLPSPDRWVWLHQVHGPDVVAVDRAPPAPPEADGAVTTRTDLPIAICVADCAPVALLGDGAVGALHAGWRGLEAGVVEAGVAAMRAAGAEGLRALLGPCARPGRYEFGEDDLERLVERFGSEVAATTHDGRPALDLPAAVRTVLEDLDVPLDDLGIDTIGSEDHFSHRREGRTGRQALVVVRRP